MEYIKLCEVISSAKTERCGASDYPVLSITKSDGVVLQSDKFKKRIASRDTEQYKLVKRGQLVQGIHIDEANFGIQSIVDIGIVSPAYKIWNVDFQKIVPKYLETVLRSPRSVRYYSSKFNGSVKRRERITDSDFLAMEIPFPSKEQQQYAVDVLEKVCSMTTLYQQQLQKLDELVKARFVELFGDPLKNEKCLPMVSGEALFKLSNGKALPNNKRFNTGIPAYGGNGISWYTDEILCNYDTIIVGRVGFQSGNVHLVKAPFWVTDNAMYISYINSRECDIRYLCALMEHIDFTRYQDAGDLKKITQKPFMQMQYLMPPLPLQKQYIAFVEQTDKSKAAVQKALDEAQLLFDSLMQKYFG